MEQKLKPCPFCGEAPTVKVHGARNLYSINCRNDKCHVQPEMSFMFEHERHAVSAWNRRSTLKESDDGGQ